MAEEPATAAAAKPDDAARRKRTQERIEQERKKLVEDVRQKMTSDTRQRVAFLLDSDPELRDSDRKLVPAYWRMFDGAELTHDDAITFDELLLVTKVHVDHSGPTEDPE